jgi:phage tail P2-like protein
MADPNILPDYAEDHERKVFSVGDPGVEILRGEIAGLRHFNNPFKTPSKHLAWRAHEIAVGFWDPDWPEDQQRVAIDAQWEIKRTRGTAPAVRLALSLLGIRARIIEWFNMAPEGQPGTFAVEAELDQVPLFDEKLWRLAFAAINQTKPLSRHYTLRMLATKTAGLFAGVAPMVRMTIIAAPLEVVPPVVTATARAGVAPFTRLTITARPKEV